MLQPRSLTVNKPFVEIQGRVRLLKAHIFGESLLCSYGRDAGKEKSFPLKLQHTLCEENVEGKSLKYLVKSAIGF